MIRVLLLCLEEKYLLVAVVSAFLTFQFQYSRTALSRSHSCRGTIEWNK